MLNANDVDYLLIGGYAVAVYGFQRYTKDFDFWIKPSKQNAKKVYKTIKDFRLDFLNFKIEDFEKEDQIFYFGNPPNRVDLMTSIEGVDFTEAFKKKNIIEYNGIKIYVISDECLVKNKIATGRDQDKIDVKNIKKIKKKSFKS